jgi:hypothetical protein
MKVKVEYTIDLSERDLAALAFQFGERQTRSGIKTYLEAQGTDSLDELVINFLTGAESAAREEEEINNV